MSARARRNQDAGSALDRLARGVPLGAIRIK